MEQVPMKPIQSDPGESMMIPMDNSTRANHNSTEDTNTSKNPVGNERGDCY